MPTPKYFDKCPPFPSDVPVADVSTISLARLEECDEKESLKLFQACSEYGVFLLDLQSSSSGRCLLQDAEAMFDLTNDVFDLGKDHLTQYAYQPPKSFEGYKASGLSKTDEGKLDAMEMYTVGRDDVLDKCAPRPKPEPFQSRKRECQEFCLHADQALGVVLDALTQQLDLAAGTLRSYGSLDNPSASNFRLLRACPASLVKDQNVTLGGHTDIGTITMLFNVAGGLQILSAEGEWLYVRPRQGCALVNLADCLVEWTGGVLKSCLHRVQNPPGRQAEVVRQSLGYFIRPSSDSSMARLRGSAVIPALADGESDQTMTVGEWERWRVTEILNGRGRLKPGTREEVAAHVGEKGMIQCGSLLWDKMRFMLKVGRRMLSKG